VLDNAGIESQQGQEIDPFSKMTRPALGPTQTPLARELGALCPLLK